MRSWPRPEPGPGGRVTAQACVPHHSVGHGATVGPHLRVDVGEEPPEGPAAQPAPQGPALRHVAYVDTRVLDGSTHTHTLY